MASATSPPYSLHGGCKLGPRDEPATRSGPLSTVGLLSRRERCVYAFRSILWVQLPGGPPRGPPVLSKASLSRRSHGALKGQPPTPPCARGATGLAQSLRPPAILLPGHIGATEATYWWRNLGATTITLP